MIILIYFLECCVNNISIQESILTQARKSVLVNQRRCLTFRNFSKTCFFLNDQIFLLSLILNRFETSFFARIIEPGNFLRTYCAFRVDILIDLLGHTSKQKNIIAILLLQNFRMFTQILRIQVHHRLKKVMPWVLKIWVIDCMNRCLHKVDDGRLSITGVSR